MNYFFIILLIVVFCLLTKKSTFSKITKTNLSVLVICKNESMTIQEFIEHYLWQGVQHFYIIDNGSTDSFKSKLSKYSGYITYYYMPEKNKQVEHYNTVYSKIKDNTQWLVVADADEYIYNRTKGKNLYDYLSTLDTNKIAAVELNWKMFGSSGNVEQPKSIRQSFTMRKKDLDENQKSIINTSLTTSLNMHTHYYKDNSSIIKNPSQLALNHYAIMSQEYFQTVKMTRGDAANVKANNIRDMSYFSKYDHKEIDDPELKNLI
jgi:glycosyltransferase involved in cell wall biosynthesis